MGKASWGWGEGTVSEVGTVVEGAGREVAFLVGIQGLFTAGWLASWRASVMVPPFNGGTMDSSMELSMVFFQGWNRGSPGLSPGGSPGRRRWHGAPRP